MMYMERSGYKSIGIKLNCLLLLLVLARLQQPRTRAIKKSNSLLLLTAMLYTRLRTCRFFG
ncbi:hypothetical protein M8C21_018638 [Ambrosia artemisiifolia]|uniref:Uncharacterized protein n=1 Tax=Ambrosia artemisiifolia TaxID=4212 RepID=A0AAD5BTK5_AMBAR|nr:hypothetical protein M8C21_018638 [Ambrosia artemisiifolia]